MIFVAFMGLDVAPARADGFDSWIRDHWSTRNGLPQSSVIDLAQSDDGVMWLATYGGLARFDGHAFDVFDRERLPDDRFNVLHLGGDGALWLGGDVHLYRLEGGVVEAVGPETPIWTIAEDASGRIFAGSKSGAFRVTGTQVEVLPVDGDVRRFLVIDDEVIAILFNGRTVCVSEHCRSLPEAPPDPGLHEWRVDPEGHLIVATPRGVYVREGDTWALRLEVAAPNVLWPPACLAWRGATWCTVGDGIHHLDQPPAEPLSRPRFSATRLFADRQGGLWMGSDGGGVQRLQPPAFEYVHADWPVFDVAEAPAGAVHVGVRSKHGPADNPWDPDVAFWPEQSGVLLVTPNYATVQRYSSAGLVTVGAIEGLVPAPGHSRDLPVEGPWVAVDAKLYAVQRDALALVFDGTSLGYARVRPIRGDEHEVWVVADDRDLLALVDGVIERRYDVAAFAQIRDVVSTSDRILLATYGSGLLYIERGSDTVRAFAGACDKFVSHIFDLETDVWLNTNRGLGYVAKASLSTWRPDAPAVDCQLIGTFEGNGTGGIVTTSGALVAPTLRGAVRIHPASYREAAPLTTNIVAFEFGGVDVSADGEARGPGRLAIRFSAPNFRSPDLTAYRYRLVGAHDAWSAPSDVRAVDYPALPPGTYRFDVQARSVGRWGPVESATFRRLPAWWETRWARAGLPAAGVALFGGLLTIALVRSRRRNAELAEEVKRRVEARRELEEQIQRNEKLARDMEVARRLEALGRLSGGIAHDVNNVLTAVGGYASVLAEHHDPAVRAEADGLVDAVRRGSEVTRGLLQFGRTAKDDEGTVDIAARAEELFPLLRRLIRSDIELHLDVEPTCLVALPSGQTDQLLTNLVLNARDAIDSSGHVTVRVKTEGELVILTVEDDGRGMSEAQLAHALEPYFTTKALGEGTGLGLATVHGIATNVGGDVTIDSELGRGTRVVVRLPRAAEVISEKPAKVEEPEPIKQIRVLFVDDRPDIGRACARMAKRLGWESRIASTLDEAVAALREGPVDVLVTDVVMPEADGPRVRAALAELQPVLPTVFVSGYLDDVDIGDDPRDVFLQKPFSLDALAQAAAAALERHSAD